MTEKKFSNELKFTVVTPSYNQGNYIEETIDSVVNQKYPFLQYIIMDGGSTDNTKNILSNRSAEISHWKSEKDEGQSHAINKGLKIADGDIFAWLNSDDCYTAGTFVEVANLFRMNPECDAVIGKVKSVGAGFEKVSPHHVVLDTVEKTAGTGGMSQPAMFFKKKLYDEIGPLNDTLHYCMDLEWWIKYLIRYGIGKVVSTNHVFSNFRIHDNSKTSSQQEKFMVERNSIYYSLAVQLGLQKKASVIRATGKVNESYIFKMPNMFDRVVALKTIDYYLLGRMDECYYQFNYDLALQYAAEIELSNLQDLDKRFFSKVMFRIKYIPKLFIKLFR